MTTRTDVTHTETQVARHQKLIWDKAMLFRIVPRLFAAAAADRHVSAPRVACAAVAIGLALTSGAVAPASAGVTELVSVGLNGKGTRENGSSAMSPDGRFVTFNSEGSNLVLSDTNGIPDLFIRDRKMGVTERVSVGPLGTQADGTSGSPSLSDNGRFVAFTSAATNLVPGDTNGRQDIFVRDRWTGTNKRVSVGPGGAQANKQSYYTSMSSDGRFVALTSEASNLVPGDTNGAADIFVHDRTTGVTKRVSVGPGGRQANAKSGGPFLSANGRFVAFYSEATNLVAGDTNGAVDIFVHDRTTGVTKRVSVGQGGAQGNKASLFDTSLSADGRFVAFSSRATNLIPFDINGVSDIFVRDLVAGTTKRASIQANKDSYSPHLSADGRFVAFSSDATNLVPFDTNDASDAFVRDLKSTFIARVSVGPGGVQSKVDPFLVGIGAVSYDMTVQAISPDGKIVAFRSNMLKLSSVATMSEQQTYVHTR